MRVVRGDEGPHTDIGRPRGLNLNMPRPLLTPHYAVGQLAGIHLNPTS